MTQRQHDYWTGKVYGGFWGEFLGHVTIKVHHSSDCAGEWCAIHKPSNHHMRDWPLAYRGDRQLMERECPHGIGHPDPDDITYRKRLGDETIGFHGCDFCCHPDWALKEAT